MGRRLCELSFAAGLLMTAVLLALSGVIPRAFTSDADVLDQIADRVADASPLLLPFAAIVFALDGILIGAGDTRYLAGAMAVAVGGRRHARAADAALRLGDRRDLGGDRGADGRAPRHDGGALRRRALGARRRAAARPRVAQDFAPGILPFGSGNPACRQPRSISAITASMTAMRAAFLLSPAIRCQGAQVVSVRSTISSTAAA